MRDEKSGRVFTGPTHQKARDKMQKIMGRRQPSTEGYQTPEAYQTPDGFITKTDMHGDGWKPSQE